MDYGGGCYYDGRLGRATFYCYKPKSEHGLELQPRLIAGPVCDA